MKKVLIFILIVLLTGCATAKADISKQKQVQPKPEKIIAFGDSNTAGYMIKNATNKWTTKLGAINTGTVGWTTETSKDVFKNVVLKQNPTTVLIMFGTNDQAVVNGKSRVSKERFRQNLQYYINELKKRKIRVVLMTVIPSVEADFKGSKLRTKTYNDITRKTARKNHITLIDNYEVFTEYIGGDSDELIIKSDIYADGFHMNEKGAEIIYQNIKKSL